MRTLTLVAAGIAAAASIAGSATAASGPVPFPSAKGGPVFISSHVTTTDGALSSASNAAPVFGPAPTATATNATGKPTLGLYVDSVNGTRPTGAAPRLVGCSQTNVYKRGEQFVLRIWGLDLKTGNVLSTDNVL